MKKIPILVAALLLVAACRSEQRPTDVLAPQAMAAVLADAYMLEGFYAVETEYRYDTMLPEVLAAYDDILTRHGTSREAVERSFEYYSAHPDQYRPIQDSALAILQRMPFSDTAQSSTPVDLPGIELSMVKKS